MQPLIYILLSFLLVVFSLSPFELKKLIIKFTTEADYRRKLEALLFKTYSDDRT